MNQPIVNALFQVLMCSYIIENNKLKMFSLMTAGGLGWFDTMLWVICKYLASHEPNKSICNVRNGVFKQFCALATAITLILSRFW